MQLNYQTVSLTNEGILFNLYSDLIKLILTIEIQQNLWTGVQMLVPYSVR